MFVENISQFVIDFINNNKSSNIIENWTSKKNQDLLVKTIKKNNITIKDPNKPKRGKSGYLFFCAEYRDRMKKENPDLSVKDIVSKLGILWKQLKKEDGDEVRRFEKMSLDDRNRYKKEMCCYVPLMRKINKKNKSDVVIDLIDIDKNKQKIKDEKKNIKKSKKSEKDEGYSKFVRSKRNKSKKTHPELDSEGILKYLEQKWEKFPESKKEKYRKK